MRICPYCQRSSDSAICPDDGYRTVTASSGSGAQDPLIGRVFEGRYRILGLVGRGGFGAVYPATQLGMGREVAVKVMHAGTTGELAEVARFQQEARVLAALKHPNVVDVYDFGQAEDGTLFIAMELLRGRSLDVELAERGRIDPAELVELGLMICDALADAHAAGVVHRALKLQNLFLADASRGRKVLKVLDFGIARIAPGEASLHLTRTGAFLDSPPYMSPEQAKELVCRSNKPGRAVKGRVRRGRWAQLGGCSWPRRGLQTGR